MSAAAWKLVPVAANGTMETAGVNALLESSCGDLEAAGDEVASCFTAMAKAAPEVTEDPLALLKAAEAALLRFKPDNGSTQRDWTTLDRITAAIKAMEGQRA